MKRLWMVMALLLAACSGQESPKPDEQSEAPVSAANAEETLAENLDIPWSIAIREGVLYISERNGAIVSVESDTGKKERLPLRLKKTIYTGGEGGFLGLALLPNTDLEAVAYHSYEENGAIRNRLIRLKKMEEAWVETDVLLEGIPGAPIHNGGRIKIGPDQKLYVTTGDAATPQSAQDRAGLSGKILRLELDGAIPDDNPFAGSPVYSYGHRNPQGLAWDEEGRLYATEHGQSAHDEINFIEPGSNYGWPDIQGSESKAGMEPPLFHTNGTTWAPSGMAYVNGKLYIATLRGEAVRVFDIQEKRASIFTEGLGRMRDVLIHEGFIYYITNNTDGRGTPKEGDDKLLRRKIE
ncbi:MAG TPA: PQQ-dependent sugar dehydrogenase [Bacillaceae bacterium]